MVNTEIRAEGIKKPPIYQFDAALSLVAEWHLV